MIQRYNKQSLAIGIPGLLLQFAGGFMSGVNANSESQDLGRIISFVGVGMLIWGLALYAKAKGRSPLWGLFGLLWFIGIIILAVLKDLEPEGKSTTLTKAELDDVFGPAPAKRIAREQLVGNSCGACGDRISSGLDAEFCSTCGNPVHHSCKRTGISEPGHCIDCGCAFSNAIEDDDTEERTLNVRPGYVSVIAWGFIVIGAAFLIISVLDDMTSSGRNVMQELSTLPAALQTAMFYAGLGVLTLCGFALMNRQNWARYLYVVWNVFGLVVGASTMKEPVALVPGAVVFLIVWFLLFRPRANEYFRGTTA